MAKGKSKEQQREMALSILREHGDPRALATAIMVGANHDTIIEVVLEILRREFKEGAVAIPDVTHKGRDYVRWEPVGHYINSEALLEKAAIEGETKEQAEAWDTEHPDGKDDED
jgi:hypothetical protein